MSVKAITLGADVFAALDYELEEGLLPLLQQFKGTDVHFVLSDVVYKTVRDQMCRHAYQDIREIEENIRCANLKKSLPEDVVKQLAAVYLPNAEDVVDERLEAFKKAAGLIIISADDVSSAQLVDDAFDQLPPFGLGADNKKEFLNAIALHSLSAWASRQEIDVTAVTEDAGWIHFAEDDAYLSVVKRLSKALELQQDENALSQAQPIKEALVAALATAKGDLYEQLVDELDQAIGVTRPSVNYDSDVFALDESGQLSFVDLPAQELLTCEVVQAKGNEMVLYLTVNISVFAEITAMFSAWNEVEQQQVNFGVYDLSQDCNVYACALVTFDSHTHAMLNVEVLSVGSIDLGELNALPDATPLQN